MNVKRIFFLLLFLIFSLSSEGVLAGIITGSTNGNYYIRITPLLKTVDQSLKNPDGSLKRLPQGELADSVLEKIKNIKAKYEKCSFYFNNRDELVPADCVPLYGTSSNCYLPIKNTFGPTMSYDRNWNITSKVCDIISNTCTTLACFIMGGEIYYSVEFLDFVSMNMYKALAGEFIAGTIAIETFKIANQLINETISRMPDIGTKERMKKEHLYVITGDPSLDWSYKKAKTFNYRVLSGLDSTLLDEEKVMTLSEVEINISEAIKEEISEGDVKCEYYIEGRTLHSEPSKATNQLINLLPQIDPYPKSIKWY